MKMVDKKWHIDFKLVGISVVIALIISLLLIGIEAWLVLNGNIPYSASKYISVLIYFCSLLFAGGAVKLILRTTDLTSMLMMSAVYLVVVLVVNLLVYSEGIHNIILALVGVGSGTVVTLLQNRQPKRPKNHRKKLRIR